MSTASSFETSVYATRNTGDLSLDVFPPTGPNLRCAVVLLHGGGWRRGSKEAVHDRAAGLAAAGFTAVAVQYRLLDAAPWPAALQDAADALTWTRANAAAIGVDPLTVCVQGQSAGAHLALMTGTFEPVEARPAAIAAFYPAVGFYRSETPPPAAPGVLPPMDLDDVGRLPSWLLFPPGTARPDLEAASPLSLADTGFPPAVLFHGAADTSISPRSTIALYQRLTGFGVPCDLHIYAGRGHEFDRAPSMTAATVVATASFIDRCVLRPADTAAEAALYPFPPAPPVG